MSMLDLLVPLLLLLAWPADALAYFDPGSGAVMLQLLLAAVIGGAYRLRKALRALWEALVSRLRR